MQKYIEVLEENLELHYSTFWCQKIDDRKGKFEAEIQKLKDAPQVTENENLKAEIQTLQDSQEIASIKSSCAIAYNTFVRLAKYDKCF